jgi:hypothetical protein
MINYLNILNVWDVVEKEYIPKYNPGTNILTTESLLVKKIQCRICYFKLDK